MKAEFGGGFRGVAKNKISGEIFHSKICETLDAARYAAKAWVFAQAGERNILAAPVYKKKDWRCFYSIRSDET